MKRFGDRLYSIGFLEGECVLYAFEDRECHFTLVCFRSNRAWFVRSRSEFWSVSFCLN